MSNANQPPSPGQVLARLNYGWRRLLFRHRWLPYVLPFAVFLGGTALEPRPEAHETGGFALALPYSTYPLVYGLKILLTLTALVLIAPTFRAFRFRISLLPSVTVGAVGAVVWVTACHLDIESRLLLPALERVGLDWILPSGTRSAFNPFANLPSPALAWGFLAVRFLGLVLVVPMMEEFFLRGFLMRFVMHERWWKIPFGQASTLAVVVGTVFPLMTHPDELLAAALWFSMVTVLMVKTRNLWDCILAHAVTNLLLGVYVVASGHWELL